MFTKLKEMIATFLLNILALFEEEIIDVVEDTKETLEKKVEFTFGGGLIAIGEKTSDFKFGASLYKRLTDLEAVNRGVKYEYNQGANYETRNWCTVYSAVTELSYLFNYKFRQCEINEIAHKMIEDGKLDPNMGAYLSDAIDYTRRWWNDTFPEQRVESYRVDYNDRSVRTVLNSKTRMSQLGYMTSKELYDDVQDDGHANLSTYPKHGGHAVSKWGVWIIDNYKGREGHRNRYNFKQFDKLLANGVIFRWGYVFLKAQ